MALIGQITVGMKVNTGGFSKGMTEATQSVEKFQKATTTGPLAGGVAATALGIGAYDLLARAITGVGHTLKSTIVGASDLNEAISKVDAVFGQAGKGIIDQADLIASQFSVVKTEAIEAATGVAQLGLAADLSAKDAVTMGNSMAFLGANLTSQDNIKFADSMEKIRSGLAGEAEPLRKYGVLLSEAAVKTRAVAMGAKLIGGNLSEQDKVMARAAIITEKLARVNGDLARTIDQPANAFRRFTGTLTNLGTSIGGAFLPVIGKMLAKLNEFASGAASLFKANEATFKTWIDAAVSGFNIVTGLVGDLATGLAATFARSKVILESWGLDFGKSWEIIKGWFATGGEFIGNVVKGLGILFRNMPDFLDIAALMIQEKIINIGEYFATIPANLKVIGEWIANNWSSMILDAINVVGLGFENLGTNLADLGQSIIKFLSDPTKGFKFQWTGLLEGFKPITTELPKLLAPALTSMQDQIDAKMKAIALKETDRARALGAAAAAAIPKPPAAAAVTAKADEYKGTAAVLAGSREAASAIARQRNQGTGADTAKATLEVNKRQLTALEKIALATNEFNRKVAAASGVEAYQFS